MVKNAIYLYSAIDTGEIEMVVTGLTILNKADVLPFQLDKELSNEDLIKETATVMSGMKGMAPDL
jgi:aspartyl-tRNA synthetase